MYYLCVLEIMHAYKKIYMPSKTFLLKMCLPLNNFF